MRVGQTVTVYLFVPALFLFGVNMEALKIIKMDEATAVVGGYGVIYGGTDLQGDTFTPDTDFMLDRVPVKFVMYDHGMTAVKGFLGDVPNESIKADDKGLWVEAQLDRSREYVNEVLKLIEEGALGYSSGSVGHLVERAQKNITRWPIVEFSLTPTPAEPRTVGVERIKSLAEQDESLKVFLPEDAGEASADTTADETGGEIKIIKEIEMTEQTKEKEAVKVVDHSEELKAMNERYDAFEARIEKLEKQPAAKAPAVLKMERGDDELKAFHAFVTGKGNGNANERGQEAFEIKASNATDMNVGTDADGGYAVPTGLYDTIIARRDEMMLANRLGVRRISGIGTTVNVPIDNEADGEFVSTNEAAQFDLDAPALAEKAFTLVKYTKRMLVSYELMDDTPTNLMGFITEWVSRGLAKTHNSLLITEAAASGTSLKTFASATAIAQGEPESIIYNDALGPYLDESESVGWIMLHSVYGELASLVGDQRQYAYTLSREGMGRRELLGYPVHYAATAGATAASAKSLYFGNWNFMGLREAPSLTFIRNPYLRADYGQLALHFHTRIVYGVLQSEAIGYGEHPSA